MANDYSTPIYRGGASGAGGARRSAISAYVAERIGQLQQEQAAEQVVEPPVYGIDRSSGKLYMNGYMADMSSADSIVGVARRAEADMANGQFRPVHPAYNLEPVDRSYVQEFIRASTVPDATKGDYTKAFVAPIVGGVGSVLDLAGLDAVAAPFQAAEEKLRSSMTLGGQAASRPPIIGNLLQPETVQVDPNANLSSWAMQAAGVGSLVAPIGAAMGGARLGAGLARAAGFGGETAGAVGGVLAGIGTSAAMEAVPERDAVRAELGEKSNEELYQEYPEFAQQVDALKADTGESVDNPTAMARLREGFIEKQATSGMIGAGFGGAIQMAGLGLLKGVRTLAGVGVGSKAEALVFNRLDPQRALSNIKGGVARRTATAGYVGTVEAAAETTEPLFSNTFQALSGGQELTRERIGRGTAEQFVAGAMIGGIAGGAVGTPRAAPPPPPLGEPDEAAASPAPFSTTLLPPREGDPNFRGPPRDLPVGPQGEQFGPPREQAGPPAPSAGQQAASGFKAVDRETSQQVASLQQQAEALSQQRAQLLADATNTPEAGLSALTAQITDVDTALKGISDQINELHKGVPGRKLQLLKDTAKQHGVKPTAVLRDQKAIAGFEAGARDAVAAARGTASPMSTLLDQGQAILEQYAQDYANDIRTNLEPAVVRAERELAKARGKASSVSQPAKRVAAVRAVMQAEDALAAAKQALTDAQLALPEAQGEALSKLAEDNDIDPDEFAAALTTYNVRLRKITQEVEDAREAKTNLAEASQQANEGVVVPEAEVSSVPEPAPDIQAQLKAAVQTGKIVFAEQGAELPKSPKGFTAVGSNFGGTYYVPNKKGVKAVVAGIKAQEAKAKTPKQQEELRRKILGYEQTREEAVAGGEPVAVVATTPEGAKSSIELVDGTNKAVVAKVKKKAQQAAKVSGGKVTTENPVEVIKKRVKKAPPKGAAAVQSKAKAKSKAKPKAEPKPKVEPKAEPKAEPKTDRLQAIKAAANRRQQKTEPKTEPKAKREGKKARSLKKKSDGVTAAGTATSAPRVQHADTTTVPINVINPMLQRRFAAIAKRPIPLEPREETVGDISHWLMGLQEVAAAIKNALPSVSVEGLVASYQIDEKTGKEVYVPSIFEKWAKGVSASWYKIPEEQRASDLEKFKQTAERLARMRARALVEEANAVRAHEEAALIEEGSKNKGQSAIRFSKGNVEDTRALNKVRDLLHNGKFGRAVRALERLGRLVIAPNAVANIQRDEGTTVKFTASDLAQLESDNLTLKTFADVFANVQITVEGKKEGLIKRETKTLDDALKAATMYMNAVHLNPLAYIATVNPAKLDFTRHMLLPDGTPADPTKIREVLQLSPLGQRYLAMQYRGELDDSKEQMATGLTYQREENLRKIGRRLSKYQQDEAGATSLEAATVLFYLSKYSYDLDRNFEPIRNSITANNMLLPSMLNDAQFADVLKELRLGKSARDSFHTMMKRHAERIKQQRAKTTVREGWEVFPRSEKPEDIQRLRDACAGTPWCTQQLDHATGYLRSGDLKLFSRDGSPRLLAAFNSDGELVSDSPRGIGEGQAILAEDLPVANELRKQKNPETYALAQDILDAVNKGIVSDALSGMAFVQIKYDPIKNEVTHRVKPYITLRSDEAISAMQWVTEEELFQEEITNKIEQLLMSKSSAFLAKFTGGEQVDFPGEVELVVNAEALLNADFQAEMDRLGKVGRLNIKFDMSATHPATFERTLRFSNLESAAEIELDNSYFPVEGIVTLALPKLKTIGNLSLLGETDYDSTPSVAIELNSLEGAGSLDVYSYGPARIYAPKLTTLGVLRTRASAFDVNMESLETARLLSISRAYDSVSTDNPTITFPALLSADFIIGKVNINAPALLKLYDVFGTRVNDGDLFARNLVIPSDILKFTALLGGVHNGSIIALSLDGNELVIHSNAFGGVTVIEEGVAQRYSKAGGAPVAATVTNPDGTTVVYIDANSITPANADSILLHESFHAFVREMIGEKAWGILMQRMQGLYNEAKEGKGREFFARALSRIPNDTPAEFITEEFGAYAVEEYERTGGQGMLASIVKWVKDLLATIRAGLMRKGWIPRSITEADLTALAKLALHNAASNNAPIQSQLNPGTIKYSKGEGDYLNGMADGTQGVPNGPAEVVNTAATMMNLLGKASRAVPVTAMSTTKHLGAKALKGVLPFMTPHMIMDWVMKAAAGQASPNKQAFSDAIHALTLALDLRTALYSQFVSRAEGLNVLQRSLDPDEKALWNKMAYEATVWRIHPNLPWKSKENKHNHSNPYMEEKWKEMNDTFYNKMSPEARTLYLDTLALETELWESIQKKAAVSETTVGPFFHLSRRGGYVVRAMREFPLQNKSLEGLRDEEHKLYASDPARYKFTKPEENPEGGWMLNVTDRTVAFSETPLEGELMRADLVKEYGEANVTLVHPKAETVLELGGMSREMYEDLIKTLSEEVTNPEEREVVMASILDIYLRMRPESNSARIMSHRANIKGADPDMWRAAHEYFNSGSMLNATLEYKDAIRSQSLVMEDSVQKMIYNKEVSDGYQYVVDEMKKYIKADTQHQSNHTAGVIKEALFVLLLSSPSYWLANLSQVPMFTFPYLKKLFPKGDATGELATAYKQSMPIIKMLVKREFQLTFGTKHTPEMRARESTKDVILNDMLANGSIDRNEQKMLSTLFDIARLGTSFTRSITQHATPDPKNIIGKGYRQMVETVAIMPHYTETLNRLVTALAAYRLAVKEGQLPDDATETAAIAVRNTQWDYANRPRAFKHPIAQVVTQFKIYALHVVNMWSDILYDLASNPVDSPEFKAAMRHMKYAVGATVLGAGTMGLPLVMLSPLLAAAGLLGGADDDDLDANGKAEKLLRDILGDEVGRAVAYGIIPNLLGVEMTNRIGSGNLIFSNEFIHADSSRGFVLESMAQLLGPAAGYTLSIADGVDNLRQGNVLRAMENVLPKAAKDAIRSTRMGTEGITTRSGRELVGADTITAAEVALTSLGLLPSRIGQFQRERGRVYEIQDFYNDTKKAYLRQLNAATTQEEVDAIWEDIEVYNARIPASDPRSKITREGAQRSKEEFHRRAAVIRGQGGLDIEPTRRWIADRALAEPVY